MPFAELLAIRKEFAKDDRFRIISVCAGYEKDDGWEAWSKYLMGRGKVDFGDGPNPFIDDPKWWNLFETTRVKEPSSRRYGVTKFPESFLIDPDGKVIAARIASEDLLTTVSAALKARP